MIFYVQSFKNLILYLIIQDSTIFNSEVVKF